MDTALPKKTKTSEKPIDTSEYKETHSISSQKDMKKMDLKVFTTNLKTQINTKKPTVRNKYKEEVIKVRKENPHME